MFFDHFLGPMIKMGQLVQRVCSTTAAKKTGEWVKVISFPGGKKAHRSSCLNTERRLDKREFVSCVLLLLKLTNYKTHREERQKRRGGCGSKDRERLKVRQTRLEDDEGR